MIVEFVRNSNEIMSQYNDVLKMCVIIKFFLIHFHLYFIY